MPKQKSIREALEQQPHVPIVDVRSEGEFAQGHIPNAISLPLFNNAERAEIGTLYKQQGQQPAILRGLEIVGPKMRPLAEAGLQVSKDGRVAVQCWRGGMRSASVAWLFERVGLTVDTVVGGYKSYRRLCLELFTSPWRLMVIGGKTGSRKTEIIQDLAARGLDVIDLESLANHRGSAFGAIPSSLHSLAGVEAQPTQEYFENLFGYELLRCHTEKTLFVEDESMLIGRLHIPQPFWIQMRASKVVVVEWPLEKRIEHLLQTYKDPEEKLRTSLTSIRKRLGDDRYNRALASLAEGRLDEVCRIALDYYDRAYTFGLSKRDPATLSVVPGEVAVHEILKLQ
jgi:tRNA 2-selenouridine synthase